MQYDSILFDLDGTLWNSTKEIAHSWSQVLEHAPDVTHVPTLAELEGVMGMTADRLMATLFPYLSPARHEELFEECCRVELIYLRQHGAVLYPHLQETLEALSKKVPLAIISNCNHGYIEAFLEAHQMQQYFTDWECIGKTGLQKWDNILLVKHRNHLKNPVYVGDTAMDAQAAGKAGVPFIHAAYGFGEVPNGEKITALPQLLQLV